LSERCREQRQRQGVAGSGAAVVDERLRRRAWTLLVGASIGGADVECVDDDVSTARGCGAGYRDRQRVRARGEARCAEHGLGRQTRAPGCRRAGRVDGRCRAAVERHVRDAADIALEAEPNNARARERERRARLARRRARRGTVAERGDLGSALLPRTFRPER